jgi:nicotinate-nucleotide adenylyltransferase
MEQHGACSAIGIFGGTFDPVHNAHLQMAIEARKTLHLNQVLMVPCHRPPHRGEPSLSSAQRLTLLEMATQDIEGLEVDDSEIKRDRPSYTVDTLVSLRQRYGYETSLVFLMGMDAYAGLDGWHEWQRLRELAHIVVLARPNSPLPVNTVLLNGVQSGDRVDIIRGQPAGGLLMLQQSLLPVSATSIRRQLMQGQWPDHVPAEIAEYLVEAYQAKQMDNDNDR